jgi:subtilisin-like proprotein convertase family protein/subtilisin family serine protease
MTKPHRTHFQIIGAIAVTLLLVFVTREAIKEVQVIPVSEGQPEISSKRPLKERSDSIQKVRALPSDQGHALQDLLADRSFVLVADGRAQRFNLSLSELYLTTAASHQRFKQLTPQPDAKHLIQIARESGLETTGWVLYSEGSEGNAASRQILHKRILIQAADRDKAVALIQRQGLKIVDEPDYSPGSIIVEPIQGGPEAALQALEQLSGDPSIRSIGPLLLRQLQKHSIPNDTLFSSQWHLKNTGQGGGKVGFDMNVTPVWDNYKGQGIKIGIVDDGLQIVHPDLATNADTTNHYDWNDSPHDTNPAPSTAVGVEDYHGTSVGGVAAARGNNNLGVSGVAPEATLVGFRLISDATTDQDDAEAMNRSKDVIHIKNNSWGYSVQMTPLRPLMEAARKDATETGRAGKGTIFVWAAGNGREYGDQGQKDASTNSIYVLTVGATNNKGELTTYSETGSHLVVTAPSNRGTLNIVTTDLQGNKGYNQTGTDQEELSDLDYTNDFGGTSSSAPAVSGAVALLLAANPDLNWRDVKEILLRSSNKLLPNDKSWVSRSGYDLGLAPIKHHQSFGGGGINVQAAVSMAETWTSLGPMIEDSRASTSVASIPDNDANGINIVFDFSTTNPMRVEHAKLNLNVFHDWRGDLEIKLTSPSGTVSTLATKDLGDNGSNYIDWNFSSVRHWGEVAKGKWTLSIKDLTRGDQGSFDSATLTLYGTDATAPAINTFTDQSQLLEQGQPLALNVSATGGGKLNYSWFQASKSVALMNPLVIPQATVGQAGRYQVKVSNAGGTATSRVAFVSVVNRSLPPTTINLGARGSVTVSAAGEGLTYQWRRNGQPIATGGKLTGMTTKTLTITNIQPEDAAGYTCIVAMSGVAIPIETLPLNFEIRYKPVVTPRIIDHNIVSGAVNEQIFAINGTTRFLASGLPPGVTISSTGFLQGRPNKKGSYKVKITAINLAGSSPPVEFDWEIEDFPLSARGTWTGIVQRQAGMNADLGGRVKLTVSNTGTYTGTITLGAKSHSWSGRVDALLNNSNPVTPFTVSRGRLLTPLTGSFTLNLTTDELSGTVSDGTNSTTFEAVKNPWSTTNKPVQASTSYNAALEVPGALLQNPLYPQGHGHVKLTLSTTGTVTWAGKLADATTLTGSTTLGPVGQTYIHALLYVNTGSAQGMSTVTLTNDLLDGSLDWFKSPALPTSTARSYKAGIPLHTLTVRGAKYSRPTSPAMIIGLDPQPPTGPLINNAKLRFTGLPLLTPLEQLFKVTNTNTTSMPTLIAENPKSVRLSLNAATGALSGTFTFTDDDPFDAVPPYAKIVRTNSYSGLLVTRPGLNQGIGYFNMAELPDTVGERTTTTPIVSGKVELVKP